MQTNQDERTYKLTRREKALASHVGELRCEACNRWQQVDEDAYEQVMRYAENNYVFLCTRKRCVNSRAENLIDERLVFNPNDANSKRRGTMYIKVPYERDLYILKLHGF